MAPRLSSPAQALLRRQRGLIADWQGPEVGLTRQSLFRAVRSGWVQVTPHVLCDHDRELSDQHLRLAGVLDRGPLAMLGGCSALIEAGWTGSARGWVDVLEPRGQRRRKPGEPQWLRCHQPRSEVAATGFPRRTKPGRAAVDAASWAASDREAVMILASSVQQRLVDPAGLLRAVDSRYGLRRAGLIRETIIDLEGGATSSNEVAFRRECRRRGLPVPRMQTRRVGGRRRTDAEFETRSGRLVIVEIDGVGHLTAESWRDDMVRHNELAVTTGAIILRVAGWEVRHDPDPFFDVLTPVVTEHW